MFIQGWCWRWRNLVALTSVCNDINIVLKQMIRWLYWPRDLKLYLFSALNYQRKMNDKLSVRFSFRIIFFIQTVDWQSPLVYLLFQLFSDKTSLNSTISHLYRFHVSNKCTYWSLKFCPIYQNASNSLNVTIHDKCMISVSILQCAWFACDKKASCYHSECY